MNNQPQIFKPQEQGSQGQNSSQPDSSSLNNTPPVAPPQSTPVVSTSVPSATAVAPPASEPQKSVIVFGHSQGDKIARSNGPNLWFVVVGLLLLVPIAGAFLYLWFLPTSWANSYLKNVQSPYQKQAAQLTTVYQSLGRPVFVGNGNSTSDQQDFSYISSVLQTATTNTDALMVKDRLTVLPFTTWSHTVSSANTEYQAMQQYVSDSQAFLSDYKTLLIYTEQIFHVGQNQLPPLENDLNKINANVNNQPAFLAALQGTTSDLQNFTNQVKSLQPSADMEQFNSNLLTDLGGMNNSLQTLVSYLQGNTNTELPSAVAEFQTSITDFNTLLNSNPTATIQTNSMIHDQIMTLEGQHPLQ